MKYGEFWTSKRQLKGRYLFVTSLHAQDTYKSVYKIDKNIKVCPKDKKKRYVSCKLNLKESSTIVVNFFSYDYDVSDFQLFVKTAEPVEDIELEYEQQNHRLNWPNEKNKKGMHTCFCDEKFKLKPNVYLFYFEFAVLTNTQSKVGNFLIKIGSTSQCVFEENTI